MAYEDFKDLPRKTAAGKILRDKAFNIAENQKYDKYQWGFAWTVYTFLIKKTSGGLIANNNIRSVILEIKTTCKIIKILIFRSFSRDHVQIKQYFKI